MRLRDQPGFDGHAFGHAQPEHQGLHAFAAENAHQVVFERKEKSRRARIALASGAATKLIVDAPRLVALGAENVQSAERDHFVVFGFALLGELVVDRLPLIGRAPERSCLRAGTEPSERAVTGCASAVASVRVCRRRSLRAPPHTAWPVCFSGNNRASSASGLPPSRMSVPRPAMLVATVTAPLRPACAMMRDSRSCCLAFSTWCGIPAAFSSRRSFPISQWRWCRPAPAGRVRDIGGCHSRRNRLPA